MYCESCGSKLPEGAKFCGVCGAQMEPNAPEQAAPPQTPPPPTPPPAYVPPPPPPQGPVITARQTYPPPYPPMYTPPDFNAPLGLGQYVGMLILMYIPIVNIILLFVWGFGSLVNTNKKNFARATLILAAVGILFSIVMGSAIFRIFSQIINEFMY